MTEKMRIPPVEIDAMTPEQAALVGEWKHLVFSRVIVNSPRNYQWFVRWIEEVIAKTVLPPRDRQVIVMRMLWMSGDTYERTHHIAISQKAGLSEEEIEAFQTGTGDCLTDFDRVLIRATDELREDQVISDETWAALGERYSDEQRMEVVFLAGCYITMAMLCKSFGIQLEPDFQDFNKIREYT
ncbi:carboxymuconolactone decarboxylase family protein [Novosphingobium sp. PC22D]|uniref:carboxymuconolactone decarboxylase family protein n=1 Tax=Novosphingobium sp. PC22D TaxID=1962403 RepID=UPI00143B5A94|nr:carboxymuconolactone decarboxylase family protein [Novosphingobium sp. PC22D]